MRARPPTPRGALPSSRSRPTSTTVALQKDGYAPLSYAGIAVLADAQQTLTFSLHVALKTIANVTSRSASSLVRPGTTADIYSINAAQQARTAVLGGGGALNSAYSAIASVPGAYVPANQNGYLQAVHVRGGDASEVGYEFDGIPVNRAFDNYPSGSLSSLGQLELQVYTGATPSNAEAQGLAGFVNQVIKTGTFPGYANRESERRDADLLPQRQRRVRRRDARPKLLLLRRHRRLQSRLPLRRSVRRRVICQRVRATARFVPRTKCAGGDDAAIVLYQRCSERRRQRNAGMDPRADRVRNDQCRQRRDAHVGRQLPHRHPAQARRSARRRAAALRQRRDLHDVPQLGQRRRLQQLDQHGRKLSTLLSRRVPVPWADRNVPAVELHVARDTLSLSVLAGASALRRDPRPKQSARPRLQRTGDLQAAVPEELQLERVFTALRLHVLLGLDRERTDDVAAAVRVLRLGRLRDQQPHARDQRSLHRPAQPAEPARGRSYIYHLDRSAHLQRADVPVRQLLRKRVRRAGQRQPSVQRHLLPPLRQQERAAHDADYVQRRPGRRRQLRSSSDLPAAKQSHRSLGRCQRDLRRRPVRLLRGRERGLRPEQYRHPLLLGVLDHRSMASQRPAFRQRRPARRQLQLRRREYAVRRGARFLVQRLQSGHVLRHRRR